MNFKDLKITMVSPWYDKSPDDCVSQWCQEQLTEKVQTSQEVAEEYGWYERDNDPEPVYQLSWKDLFRFHR